MTKEQVEAIKAYMSALIAERISTAFGRDRLEDSITLSEAEREFDHALLDE